MKLKFIKGNSEDSIFDVKNNKGEFLGWIDYCVEWKCFVWFQAENIQMSYECLQQIADKLKEFDKGKR
jgi:hypothetical protein